MMVFLLAIANFLPGVRHLSAFAPPADSERPNIVVIFIDDLGYGDIGPFGATKQKTPNLDRMASEGMKLTSFYAAPVCSVSRAQLMTGCYGVRVSVPGVFGTANRNGLHPADNDMQRKSTETGKSVVPLLRDDQVAELLTDDKQSQITERYTDEATRFIRNHQDKPFFLYMPHTAVHTPIYPGEAFRGKSANGRFGDWVEEVDWSVGKVLDTLQSLNLDRNTMVLFTSDNGPWLIKGSDGGIAGPLRGGKGSTWEGGVRVPTIARWPGKIPAGSVCDAVAGTIDILPTCVSIAGAKASAEPIIDGRDISSLLFGTSKESKREAHYYFAGINLQAVRQGPWKLAIANQPESMGMKGKGDAEINPRLYNLDADIGEQSNVASKHPEIVLKLQALADKANMEIGGASPTARRPAGQSDNPQTLYPSEKTKK